jgi:hypothetical protein
MMADKSSSASDQIAKVAVGPDGGALAEAASVDKIRDLLFGNQMRDYDQRFAKLEARFLERLKDIESEAARNLSAFESNTKKQVDSLAGQLRDEKEQRADNDKDIERVLREQNQVLEKRIRGPSRSSLGATSRCLSQQWRLFGYLGAIATSTPLGAHFARYLGLGQCDTSDATHATATHATPPPGARSRMRHMRHLRHPLQGRTATQDLGVLRPLPGC